MEDPYQAPKSNLNRKEVPAKWSNSSLTVSDLKLAGWLSLLMFVMTVFLVVLEYTPDLMPLFVLASLEVIHGAISIFLFFRLFNYLQDRFECRGFGLYVILYSLFSIVLTALSCFNLYQADDSISIADKIILFLLLAYGVFSIFLGMKMKQIQYPNRELTWFASITLYSGIMTVTLVLLPVALILWFIWNILLALLFFKGANELAEARANSAPGQ